MSSLYRKVISSFLAAVLLLNLWGIVTVQAEELTGQSYVEIIGEDLTLSPGITINSVKEFEAARSSAYAPSCNTGWRPGASGYSRTTTNYNPMTNSLQWGFELTPKGKAFFGPFVTVSGIGGSVSNPSLGYFRTLFGNSIYAPHNRANDYLFHGSITRYNYMGGQGARLNSGDIVEINLGAVGTAAHRPSGNFSITCQID
ncbi:hypothetical protein [Paenibacillus faecalis]|uniref:hypothetical protein n=1 Tax=Paenibacillus faecalis TaxID=2079532 RepID=UPI000D0FD3C7|nr:hypothetical protein [Paenibacillus faecalis]